MISLSCNVTMDSNGTPGSAALLIRGDNGDPVSGFDAGLDEGQKPRGLDAIVIADENMETLVSDWRSFWYQRNGELYSFGW
jgi:hypothetical protein